ncbi:DUF305 domain-containing protein [Jiangella alkaliphila]|uniref:Uncharacterized conserved protein, DUF305 family n=1 Tax=Jiangella alkaliphila TaxID=419479 RepID=A0A1H2KRB9_9ACTN|nr:DUF305 domain-containing protein [Jiangella alkaliphila]SDU71182.1 Uncharacterized conserved protein, DUF305 family [Jiangella alkaliphila]
MLIARRTLIAVLAVGAVAGCTSDDEADRPPVVQLGPPGETGTPLTDDELTGLDQPQYTDADVAFVQGMIQHHAQALVMTDLVVERAGSDDLPLMAERMDVSQRDEIALLEEWLETRGEDVPDASGEHHEHGEDGQVMPGMLTDDDLARLAAATGRDFDELFLLYMIRHHEGALVMVGELLTAGEGGQESALFQLAQHIDSDQGIEIARMKSLLAEIAASPGS